jgi:membrane dipeptidase
MSQQANELLHKSIVVDGLFHSLLIDPPPMDGRKDTVDLLLAGGVNIINGTVVLDYYKNDFPTFCRELHRFFVLEEACPEKVLLVRSYADILQAKRDGKLGIILSMQGADALEHDLRYVAMLYKLGVRLIQITYNQRNNLGCGVF